MNFLFRYAGNVTFSIPADIASNKFAIASNGLVTLRSSLDREKVARYSVSILARSSKLLDITTLEVIVLDENDNSPEFRPNSCYTLAVPENQEIFGIHTVAATDLDEGNNGEISYIITGKSPVDCIYRLCDYKYLRSLFAICHTRVTANISFLRLHYKPKSVLYNYIKKK